MLTTNTQIMQLLLQWSTNRPHC